MHVVFGMFKYSPFATKERAASLLATDMFLSYLLVAATTSQRRDESWILPRFLITAAERLLTSQMFLRAKLNMGDGGRRCIQAPTSSVHVLLLCAPLY